MEITIIKNYKTVLNYRTNREQRRSLDNLAKKILEDKEIKVAVILTIITTATVLGITVSEAFFPAVVACSTGLGGAGETIRQIMNEIIGFAKIVLIGMVIFNTILGTIQIIWKGSGGKMSYEEIFGVLFKNLCILACGLSVDKICWWLWGLLG